MEKVLQLYQRLILSEGGLNKLILGTVLFTYSRGVQKSLSDALGQSNDDLWSLVHVTLDRSYIINFSDGER